MIVSGTKEEDFEAGFIDILVEILNPGLEKIDNKAFIYPASCDTGYIPIQLALNKEWLNSLHKKKAAKFLKLSNMTSCSKIILKYTNESKECFLVYNRDDENENKIEIIPI